MNRFLFRVLFLPLSLDELSRGIATVISHFDRNGSITVGSHQIKFCIGGNLWTKNG
ncbi:hypothetical protein [Clostridium ljungdahlii]|uniref:hypothetical protein n=1 Tax=Clostridium ljungdahlii TaxID=1538 RepID=UPI0012E6FC33|nr:hypothetical protein [Clostridium ljungdahlii]